MDIEALQELEIDLSEMGPQGYSAYEIAVLHGYEGTEEEWLASLKGEKGDKGENGSIVSVSDTGTSTDEVQYITIDGIEHKLAGSSGASTWNEVTEKPFETIGQNLKVVGSALAVDTADEVEADETRPITSAGVHVVVGNINTLLSLI